MRAGQSSGMSWPAVLAWVCVILFLASLWSGADRGPLFWVGVVSLDVLVVGCILVLVRWITRRAENHWG